MRKKIRGGKYPIGFDSATSTSEDFGYKPVPGKGGATTNFEIPEWMFERELKEMKEGIIHA